MNLQPGSTIKAMHPGTHNGTEIRFQGVWLLIARIAWVIIALLSIALFVAALPSYSAYLHSISVGSSKPEMQGNQSGAREGAGG